MKLKLLSVSVAALCASMMITNAQSSHAQLQPLAQPDPEWLTQMYEQGWQKVAEGVLQRSSDGSSETFTYGEGGLRWNIQHLQGQVTFLEGRYNAHPSPELAQVIDRLKSDIAQVEATLQTGQVEVPSGDEFNNCDISYGAHAYADPLTGASAPGVTARADAYFHNNCGYSGSTYAYAYVEAASGSVFSTKMQEDPKYSGTWLDSFAQWSLPGSSNCFSRAYGRAWNNSLNVGYETEDLNYSCPTPPPAPVVTVSGPTNVYTNYHSTPCANVTWTASTSSGVPPYTTYDWYINNVYQSSGGSLTVQYCYTDAQVNVKAIGRDSIGQSDDGLFTTWVDYEEEPYDPCMYGGCGCNGGYDPYTGLYRPYEICEPVR